MPQIRLWSTPRFQPIPVEASTGSQFLLPRVQLRALVLLPGQLLPRDAIIDTGSPFNWCPEDVWQPLRPGTDFEWLPFAPGYQPPVGQTAGWNFRFRMARLLGPLTLTDLTTELPRDGVIFQFAEGNPPGTKRLPVAVIGLWGGVLEGTKLHIEAAVLPAGVTAALEF